jgi:hypothetical protein
MMPGAAMYVGTAQGEPRNSTLTERSQRAAAQAGSLLDMAIGIENRLVPAGEKLQSKQAPEPNPDHVHWALESLERRLNALGETLDRIGNAI